MIGYDHIQAHIKEMPTERVTVTLAAELVEGIDRVERNRSRFIAEAVERELTRRREEALRLSLRSPHVETREFSDGGLGEWLSDAPADQDLVDATSGTPVRWVDGEGWTRDRT